MSWKPKPPIAAALGLFATPLGMLYVQRPWLAMGYFVLSVLAGSVAFLVMSTSGSTLVTEAVSWSGWLVAIACALHAFLIARATSVVVERRWYSRWYGMAGIVIGSVLAIFLIRAFLYEPFRVPSDSMYPNVPSGSIVFVQKSGHGNYGTYGLTLWRTAASKTLRRGDVVVHQLSQDPAVNYVSRVVALPGDHIRYVNREMTINGQVVPDVTSASRRQLSVRYRATGRSGRRDRFHTGPVRF